jgi:hypothetical protein
VVEGAFDQLLDRPLRRQPLEVEFALLGPDFLIDPFQHGEVERVLVAEIVIYQLLVDAGAGGDLVDPGTGKTVLRKFPPRRHQQLAACRDRIASLGFSGVRPSFRHFQPNS